jgi:2-polyprenyl-3-methyl-5-hydroxy-6-metoxy-1,4-benzoquinol methylase
MNEKVKKSYEYQWEKLYNPKNIEPYSSSQPTIMFKTKDKDHVKILLNETKLPEGFFRNKKCLDAGCGFGRLIHATQELGARESHGFDLTDKSVNICMDEFKNNDKVFIKQGDITERIYPENHFDFVSSWGVLMYTKHPKRAFGNLASYVNPDGYLFLHVYERYWKVKGFLVWCVRRIVNLLPVEKRVKITDRFIGRHRWLQMFFEFSQSRYQAYDAYSPSVVHRFKHNQMIKWFNENGFDDVRITKEMPEWRDVEGFGNKMKHAVFQMIHGRYRGDFNIIGKKCDEKQ